MIRKADIQYLACDYLAELTLSIMARQKIKDPGKGFAPDFVTRLLKEAGREAFEKKIRIITNAGGMNVRGCVDSIKAWAEAENLKGYKIGYVTGDDIKDKIYNCNAYIGHEQIRKAIAEGADTVITGRAADALKVESHILTV